jgi:four helix bundle protein
MEVRMPFDHEKLDVYRVSIDFLSSAERIVGTLPRGRAYLADQLQRAALSIVLNIAEGAGKFSPADKASFYARARGSATECAVVLDVCRQLQLIDGISLKDGKEALERISQMLTRLTQAHQDGRARARARSR